MVSKMQAAAKAGIPPEKLYAMQKTGLILGERTPITSEQEQEWNDAIEEYFRLIEEGKKQ
jgi:hypothetical protein